MFSKSLYSKSNLIRKDLVEEGGRRFSSPHHAIKVLFFAKGKNLAVKMYLDGRSYYPVRKNTYDGHLGSRQTERSLTQLHCNLELLIF